MWTGDYSKLRLEEICDGFNVHWHSDGYYVSLQHVTCRELKPLDDLNVPTLYAVLDKDGLCPECAEILADEEADAVIDGDVVSDDFNVVNERLLAIEAKSDRVDA